MYVSKQLIVPTTGAASYTSPANVRSIIKAAAVDNITAGAVACAFTVQSKEIDGKTLLAGEKWIPDKLLNQVMEPADVMAFSGAGVNVMVSGLVTSV